MSNSPTPDKGAAAEVHLASAVTVFDVLRTELAGLLQEVAAGETARARKLAPMITELSRAVGTMAREAERVETARRADGEQERTHDLEAARAEIGRRLDRLRRAAAAKAVPEGSE